MLPFIFIWKPVGNWYNIIPFTESGIRKYCKIDRASICLTLQEYNMGIYIQLSNS